MFKKSLIILMMASLPLLASDASKIAIKLCEYSKKGDLKSMQKYASAALIPQLEQISNMLDAAKSTPEGKAQLEKGLLAVAHVDCKATTKLTKNTDGSMAVVNTATKQHYTLKKINNRWEFPQ